VQNVDDLRDRVVTAAESVASEMLGDKLNIVLMCVVPLMLTY